MKLNAPRIAPLAGSDWSPGQRNMLVPIAPGQYRLVSMALHGFGLQFDAGVGGF